MKLSRKPTPLQWALPEALEIPPDKLQVRLDFYQDAVLMHVVNDGVIAVHMVSARDIALTLLQDVSLTSGLLPANALWWSQTKEGPEVALWQQSRVWPVALMTEPFKPPRRLKLPLPGLIFVCQPGRPPRVYAARHKPTHLKSPIYHAPLFNIFGDGRSCPGTHKYPQNIEQIPESFFTSFFSPAGELRSRSLKYPNNLLGLWEELDGKRRYPLKDLVHLGQVDDIIAGH